MLVERAGVGAANPFNKNAFAEWYYTEGGVASTVPVVTNKQAFITGRKTGLEIHPVKEGG